MVCIIAGGKKHYGRLWRLVGKDKDGKIVFDENYCCSSPAINKEAMEVLKEQTNIKNLEMRSLTTEDVEYAPIHDVLNGDAFRRELQ